MSVVTKLREIVCHRETDFTPPPLPNIRLCSLKDDVV